MKFSLGVVEVRRHSAVGVRWRGGGACASFASPRLELGALPDDGAGVVGRALAAPRSEALSLGVGPASRVAVSYTHLTLPTIYSV